MSRRPISVAARWWCALGALWGILAAVPADAGHGAAGLVLWIQADHAKRLLDDGERLIFVDLRSAAEFRMGRVRGAHSLPLAELSRRHAEIPRTGRVILYCACPYEQLQAAYSFLWQGSYRNVSALEGGFQEWAKRGYPVER